MLNVIKTKIKVIGNDSVKIEKSSNNFNLKMKISIKKSKINKNKINSGFIFVDNFLNNLNAIEISLWLEKKGVEDEIMVKEIGIAFGDGLRKLIKKNKGHALIFAKEENLLAISIIFEKIPEINMQLIGNFSFNTNEFFAFFDGLSQGLKSKIQLVNKFYRKVKKETQIRILSKGFDKLLESIIKK